jgi:putative polyketide hydroxylase
MNTAIRSGHDLGWKLGWVLRGWAGPELLATYEAERRPIAAHNIARSADPDGSTRDAADELHVDLGGRIAHVWVHCHQGRVSTLDLLGPGLTLFTGPDSFPSAAQANGGPPLAVRRLDAVSARAIGIRGHGGLLVRPDGTPSRLWTHEAIAAA